MRNKEGSAMDSFKITAQSQANSVKYKWQQGKFTRKAKELFMVSTNNVTYKPLQGPAQIRLLTLEPGASPGSIVRCSMRHVDLGDQLEYTALSYTWKSDPTIISGGFAMAKSYAKTFLSGAEPRLEIPQDAGNLKFSKEIVCNGMVSKISPNLYNALVQLRKKRAGDYWIDALCINQDDPRERAAQIQLMGQIYKRASQVVVWLGATGRDLTDSVAYLDHLATHALDIPPISIWDIDDNVEEKDQRLIPYRAIALSISIIMSQWFRRTWVVQELCWAKDAVFMIENAEMSIQCVAKAFDVARSASSVMKKDPESNDLGWATIASILKGLSRVWVPQLHYGMFHWPLRMDFELTDDVAPMTLKTRETFQRGDMWTLRQWLIVCKGRLATEPQDLIFAGLSLIKPDLLAIDQSLQCSEPAPVRNRSDLPFFLRKYYPQVIPPAGIKQPTRPSRRGVASCVHQPTPVLPKGLWPKLHADYQVSIPEVLVNTAACLLTHTGTEEILSIAARTSRPEKFTSKWWLVPDDQLAKESLPSWTPAPGTWASHVSEVEAFCQHSRPRAYVSPTDRPRISKDGSALFLGASRADVIDQFYIGLAVAGEWDADESNKSLDVMLATLIKHRRQKSLTALSQLLFGPNTQESPLSSGDAEEWTLQQLSRSAYTEIARSRTNQLYKRPRRYDYPKKAADGFALWFGKCYRKSGARADELVSLLADVQAAYPDENWPKWANPLQFDMEIHKAFLRQLAETSSNRSGSDPGSEGQSGSASDTNRSRPRSSVKALDKTQTRASRSRATEEMRASQEESLLSKLEPEDSGRYARLTVLVQTRLAWRKIFITRQGFLGLGPTWLHRGDIVMLVRAAQVPYAFTPLQADLQRREKDVRETMDNNQNKYNEIIKTLQTGKKKHAYLHPIDNVVHSHGRRKLERLDEEEEKLYCKLDRLSATPPWSNAWVLQGEVSIESTFEQQAMEREAWDRITII